MSQSDWNVTSINRDTWGQLQVVIDGVDVTYYRDAPTIVERIEYGEPFDEKMAIIRFPQMTAIDEMPQDTANPSTEDWLRPWAPVEINRIPPTYASAGDEEVIFEGFVAGFTSEARDVATSLVIECIGALYQADFYVRAPVFPRDPQPIETAIGHGLVWNSGTRKHLQTAAPVWEFPGAWPITFAGTSQKATGWMTRRTGSWDRLLTGYVQQELAHMVCPADPVEPEFFDGSYGAYEGRVWTLMMEEGRVPTYRLKDVTTVTNTFSAGQPGVTHTLDRDYTQVVNVIYGEGSDAAGTVWRNANRGGQYKTYTTYEPVGYDSRVHPSTDNNDFDPDWFRVENFSNFGNYVSLTQGQKSADKVVNRDKEPGWYGTITVTVDPQQTGKSRFDIRAGENLRLRQFGGSDDTGIVFHIASVTLDFANGSVSMKVDTKARDEATLASIVARRRDNSIFPTRGLQPVARSKVLNDTYEDWDYERGSGYIPTGYKDFRGSHIDPGNRPQDETDFTTIKTGYGGAGSTHGGDDEAWGDLEHHLARVGTNYVFVNGANTNAPKYRWTIFPIVAAGRFQVEKFTLSAYNDDGSLNTSCRFHWGLYKQMVDPHIDMPWDEDGEGNPLGTGAYDVINNMEGSPQSPLRLISWGQEGQACGYWPGLESDGDPVTGQFVDEGRLDVTLDPGVSELWVAIYATDDAWFAGRLTNASHVAFDDLYRDEVV